MALTYEDEKRIVATQKAVTRKFRHAESWGIARLNAWRYSLAAFFPLLGFYFGVGYVTQDPHISKITLYLPHAMLVGFALIFFGEFGMKRAHLNQIDSAEAAEMRGGSLENSAADLRVGMWFFSLLYQLTYLFIASILLSYILAKHFKYI